MSTPFVRNPYNYNVDEASDESALFCGDESLTVQAPTEECDINTIVRRFGLTGELPNVQAMPRSGDFTGIPDYHTALNLVNAAQKQFLTVPADVRARFDNDPQKFMTFVEDENNRDEAEKLGLLKPKPSAPVVQDVRIVNPPQANNGS